MTQSPWKEEAVTAARHLSRGTWAGILTGLVIGGVGGRLAMLVLRLTSDPSLGGRLTDDNFVIGEISGDTLFLVLFCTVIGMAGGILYLAIRGWLPAKGRPAIMAVFGGAVGGSVIIRPGGIDFTQLDPLLLAVVMFIVLPALCGWSVSYLAERWIARGPDGQGHTSLAGFLPLLGLALGGPPGVGIGVVVMVGWLLNRNGVPITRLWRSAPVTLVGRCVLLGLTASATFALSRDIAAVL